MWTRAYTRATTAEPERLWALLSDVEGWVTWNDGIESIALHGPLAVGSTFEMTPPGEAGAAVSADFPDVTANLAAMAEGSR